VHRPKNEWGRARTAPRRLVAAIVASNLHCCVRHESEQIGFSPLSWSSATWPVCGWELGGLLGAAAGGGLPSFVG
jgi:hypothetical protein